MPVQIPEKDWKVFRRLHEVALERFCKRILEEVHDLAGAGAGSYHDRYLKVYRLIENRDKEIGNAFNDVRRSSALIVLSILINEGFVSEAELDQFSPETRQIIKLYRGI